MTSLEKQLHQIAPRGGSVPDFIMKPITTYGFPGGQNPPVFHSGSAPV